MDKKVLLALFVKFLEEKLEEISSEKVETASASPLVVRGPRGLRGEDGKDFDFEEHRDKISALIQSHSLTFDKLTEEQLESLRGPKGRDGRDGKSFDFEEHREFFESLALTFDKLTPEQVESLRGPQGPRGEPGRPGVDGKDFDFEEHREFFESLKLKFSDLTLDEVESLRGPRGRDGRDGKSFDFEEHREFFESLKLKFEDLTGEEIESLKLKFSDLTPEEVDSLKLKFSDLTPDDIIALKGPRGQRGKQGNPGDRGEKGDKGEKGDIGPRGPQGLPGVPGPVGRAGPRGEDGRDGVDGSPGLTIIDAEIVEENGYIYFLFIYSNGEHLKTNKVLLPKTRSGSPIFSISTEGFQGQKGDKGEPGEPGEPGPPGEQGPAGPQGPPGDSGDGTIPGIECDEEVFVGAFVRLDEGDEGDEQVMEDWPDLLSIPSLDFAPSSTKAKLAIADSWDGANVFGIVVSKETDTSCTIARGVTGPIFYALDVTKDYYLSDVYPGRAVPEHLAPQDPGSVVVRVGNPLSNSRFAFSRGDRKLIE